MNAKRIETTRAARELAEQRLDAERKRFEVGMSTSFLVIQAQRDLAQAKTNELAAVLAYDLALVDFEALQEAGPPDRRALLAGAPQAPVASSAAAAAAAPRRASGDGHEHPGILRPPIAQGRRLAKTSSVIENWVLPPSCVDLMVTDTLSPSGVSSSGSGGLRKLTSPSSSTRPAAGHWAA